MACLWEVVLGCCSYPSISTILHVAVFSTAGVLQQRPQSHLRPQITACQSIASRLQSQLSNLQLCAPCCTPLRHTHPQKLGLNAAALRGAFTTLTSTLTSLRTEAGPGLTLRTDIAATGACCRGAVQRECHLGGSLIWVCVAIHWSFGRWMGRPLELMR